MKLNQSEITCNCLTECPLLLKMDNFRNQVPSKCHCSQCSGIWICVWTVYYTSIKCKCTL